MPHLIAQNEELTLIAARVEEIFTSAEREILQYQRTGTNGSRQQENARYYCDDFRIHFF